VIFHGLNKLRFLHATSPVPVAGMLVLTGVVGCSEQRDIFTSSFVTCSLGTQQQRLLLEHLSQTQI